MLKRHSEADNQGGDSYGGISNLSNHTCAIGILGRLHIQLLGDAGETRLNELRGGGRRRLFPPTGESQHLVWNMRGRKFVLESFFPAWLRLLA